MIYRTSFLFSSHGFYIAAHPWLKSSGFVKVGCTANLSRRLEMPSFTTCFTPEWTYLAVFECESVKEAFLLEQAVLFVFREKRVPQRELIKGCGTDVIDGARRVCAVLNLYTLLKLNPTYETDDMDSLNSGKVRKDSSIGSSSARDYTVKPSTLTNYIDTLDVLRETICPPYENKTEIEEEGISSDETNDAESNCLFDIPDSQKEEMYSFTALRPYQEEAVTRCLMELGNRGATICQMACRCGKTPVAFKIIEHYLENKSDAKILFLVPGLALLRQTAKKLFGYGLRDVEYLLIGSFVGIVELDSEHALTMTTDVNFIEETIQNSAKKLVVISTYQSSHMVSKINQFTLTIFDECHRVCGSAEETSFNSILLKPRSGKRLFLTATPAYDTPIKMDNILLFGGIAYRYYLREGIDSGYVNSFALRIILGESIDTMNHYLYEAMRIVNKMIVYARSIEHAIQIAADLRNSEYPKDLEPFKVFLAHSRIGSSAVATVLRDFTDSRRSILINVRLFQEGVEISDLNAVFFAAPRYSSRDIVQSICRPLNKMENKPKSYVFLPATMDKSLPEDDPVNLQKFSTLIPFTDALMDEDPVLFEYLIDPQKVLYDIDVLGVRSLKLSSERIRKFVLPAIRRGVRYSAHNTDRLHRAARVPWRPAFHELRRIVLECNRYPKNNDAWVVGKKSISMALFYRYVRKGYQQFLDQGTSYLQTYQLKDLESLPLWLTYGLQGPYPWRECLQTLARHLKKHKRLPPLDVHKGGYIGLDATPFERLSGALMHINQCDAHDKLRLDITKQDDLDRLFAPSGLKWRKGRDASGKIIPGETTCITESYETFKKLFEDHRTNGFQNYIDQHFPGYPAKHERMEDPRNLRNGRVPPRHVTRDECAEPRTLGKVMCRVCRRHIAVRAWERHLRSVSHVSRLKKISAPS